MMTINGEKRNINQNKETGEEHTRYLMIMYAIDEN